MAFFHVGGTSTQPTFFEVYAADKLVPSLKSAVTYSLSVGGSDGLLPGQRVRWGLEPLLWHAWHSIRMPCTSHPCMANGSFQHTACRSRSGKPAHDILKTCVLRAGAGPAARLGAAAAGV